MTGNLYLSRTSHWLIFTMARFSGTLFMMLFHLSSKYSTDNNYYNKKCNTKSQNHEQYLELATTIDSLKSKQNRWLCLQTSIIKTKDNKHKTYYHSDSNRHMFYKNLTKMYF